MVGVCTEEVVNEDEGGEGEGFPRNAPFGTRTRNAPFGCFTARGGRRGRCAGEVFGEGVDGEFAGGVDACDADVGAEGGVCFDGMLDEGVGGAVLGGAVEGAVGAVTEIDAEGQAVDVVKLGMEKTMVVGVGLEVECLGEGGTRNGGIIDGRGNYVRESVAGCHDTFAFTCLFERRGKSMGGERGVQGN
jgi:hypothetical protein